MNQTCFQIKTICVLVFNLYSLILLNKESMFKTLKFWAKLLNILVFYMIQYQRYKNY